MSKEETNIKINTEDGKSVIWPELHSHFIEFLGSCIYDGIWVGEDSDIPNYQGLRKDVVDGLKELEPAVIRWPGGCYADTYHFRNGIGKREERPVTYNENFGTYEQDYNQFGTHEFMALCKAVGAKPWLNVNMLSGSIAEMREWMEYCNREEETDLSKERAINGSKEPFSVEYWGLGNEVWGGGGTMQASDYAAEYRKFSTAVPSFAGWQKEGTIQMKRIACGPDGNKQKERMHFTKEFFQELGKYRLPQIDGYDLHFYNWNLRGQGSSELEFDKEEWYEVVHNCLELEEVIAEQHELMVQGMQQIQETEDLFFMPKPKMPWLIVGEWGNWHKSAFLNRPALYQQCCMRDAVTTALTLDIFHRNCERVRMACVAQSVNVLNSLFLTNKEKCIYTPNYDVFWMYRVHKGATLITISGEAPKDVYMLASRKEDVVNVNLVNASYDCEKEVFLNLSGEWEFKEAQVLEADAPEACNTFENPNRVRAKSGKEPERNQNGYKVKLAAFSVNVYQFTIRSS